MINELEANLSSKKAELKLAEVTYQRQFSLSKSQAVSKDNLDEARTEVEVKKAQVAGFEAQIDGIVTFIKTLQGQMVITAQEAPTIKNVRLLPLSAFVNEISPQVYEVEILNGEKVEKGQAKICSRNDVFIEVIDGLK